MKVNGKVRKISPHAVAAYTVREGEGALVIVLRPAKGDLAKQYVLRYYDLDSGRRRVLGTVPMNAAKVEETGTKGEAWAFTMSGVDATTSQPTIVVGDLKPTFCRTGTRWELRSRFSGGHGKLALA